MRNKAFSRLLLLAGAVLLAAAVGFALLGARQKTARQAELSDSLRDMQALLSEPAAGVTGDRTDGEMPQLELNGRDYIGLLELPERGITLPAAADWDTGLFSFRPARCSGTLYDGSLVIGGSGGEDCFAFYRLHGCRGMHNLHRSVGRSLFLRRVEALAPCGAWRRRSKRPCVRIAAFREER